MKQDMKAKLQVREGDEKGKEKMSTMQRKLELKKMIPRKLT